MKKKSLFIYLPLFLATTLGTVSCGKTTYVTKQIADGSDIVLDKSAISLDVGKTYTLDPSFYDMSTKEKSKVTCEFTSLNENIATVSDMGVVTAVSEGETIIQVTYLTYKTLVKVTVEKARTGNYLNLDVGETDLTLYANDTYQLNVATYSGESAVAASVTYSGYDASVISVSENGFITAKTVGTTTITVSAIFEGTSSQKTVSVSVVANAYSLSAVNTETQVVVGEEDLTIHLAETYGSSLLHKYSLDQVNVAVDHPEYASVVGGKLHAIKKGNVVLTMTVYSSEAQKELACSLSLRVREKYTITYQKTGEKFYVYDGDKATSHPEAVGKYEFNCWLYEGNPFDDVVEQDMTMDIQWKVNEFDFSTDLYGAHTEIPYLSSEKSASYHSDRDSYYEGLNYHLVVNLFDGGGKSDPATMDKAGYIYLPKMDYREISSVTYHWETTGWCMISDSYWYAGGDNLGGTISITSDGDSLLCTITQELDRKNPFNGTSYKDATKTLNITDSDIISGKKALSPFVYFSFESILAEEKVMMDYPTIIYNESEPYLPDFSSRTYGASYVAGAAAHFQYDATKPVVIPHAAADGEPSYLLYYQDSWYDETQGYVHGNIDYTVGLPKINFSRLTKNVKMDFQLDSGVYLGLDKDHVLGSNDFKVKGSLLFSEISSSSMKLSFLDDAGKVVSSLTITDQAVLKGEASYIMPTCYIFYRFERDIRLYTPYYVA